MVWSKPDQGHEEQDESSQDPLPSNITCSHYWLLSPADICSWDSLWAALAVSQSGWFTAGQALPDTFQHLWWDEGIQLNIHHSKGLPPLLLISRMWPLHINLFLKKASQFLIRTGRFWGYRGSKRSAPPKSYKMLKLINIYTNKFGRNSALKR